HRSREGWAADGEEEDLGSSGPRGADGAVPNRQAFQARLRGADAGATEELPLPLCRGQAVGDAGGADRKGDAGDLRRQRVSGETPSMSYRLCYILGPEGIISVLAE